MCSSTNRRVADEQLDAVAHQLGAHDLDLLADHVLGAGQQVGRGDLLLDPVAGAVQLALAHPGQVDDRLAQRLRRDGAGVDAHAAEHRPRSMTATDLPSFAAAMAAF